MRAAGGVAVLALGFLAACGSEDEPQGRAVPSPSAQSSSPVTSPTPTPTAPSAPPRTGTTVITAGSKFGPMLYDASGQPIYLFDKERSSTPQCYGECAEAWPPVLTQGLPQAKKGTREALLGTTKRTDGTRQVTYAGHPLYYYAHEGKYQVLCHNVREYGGVWLVVRPDGEPGPV